MPKRDITWWFWLATDIALANCLFVDREFIKVAIALSLIQVPIFCAFARMEILPDASQNRIPLPAVRRNVAASRDNPLDTVRW